jgi:23S rRNA (adenine2503-C2)-methyltransferase
MPVANKYDIHEVIDACKYYFDVTGRRITFEYSLVGGVNDTDQDAKELTQLIKGINCHVNLIPVNPVDGSPFSQSDARIIREFQNKLAQLNVNATIRRRLGQDISAACGQLRNEHR